jgi:SWI/SNF-related matrix-associated actin-dependent regulator 1 of chromatin subfamily A
MARGIRTLELTADQAQGLRHFPNSYPGYCCHPGCGVRVDANMGMCAKVNGVNYVWCKGHSPFFVPPVVRRLHADGYVEMPYERDNLDLVRSFPGAFFDGGRKQWRVSLDMADRRRVLEIADNLKLEVAEELRHVAQSEQAKAVEHKGLRPYQVVGVDFLANMLTKGGALLGDDMGLGKTCESLCALPAADRVLVIAPAVAKYNWRNEIAKWRTEYRTHICEGVGSFRLPEPGEVVIINYDILPDFLIPQDVPVIDPATGQPRTKLVGFGRKAKHKVVTEEKLVDLPEGFADAMKSVTIIADEAHRVKNHKAQRSRKVKTLAKLAKASIPMTGTPITNRPFDLWGLLSTFGFERRVFKGFNHFLDCFQGNKNKFGGYDWGTPLPIVPELLRRVMLRRLKSEVARDIPDKTYTDLVVNGVSAKLAKQMDKMEAEYGDQILAGVLPPFEEMSAIRAELARARIPAMLEYVEDHEEQEVPLIVACDHVEPLKALGEREGWEVIMGSTPNKKRQEIVDAFQRGELKGVALSIAVAEAITLTRGSKMLFIDLSWTPAQNTQCEDRIHRIGQTADKVEIVRMRSNHPLDQHIHDLLAWKTSMFYRAIEFKNAATVPNTQQPGETVSQFRERMEKVERENREREERAAEEEKLQRHGRTMGLLERNKARVARQLLPLTDERKAVVRRAFSFMLSVCDGAEMRDGQGFNKPDALVAHWMLSGGLHEDYEVETAYYILTRYYGQLHEDYENLFKPFPGEELPVATTAA